MAVFGAPVSHEDDPERAVRAALAAREAVQELNEANPALDLHVRIAVNTGEAVVALDARPVRGRGHGRGRRRQHGRPSAGGRAGGRHPRRRDDLPGYRACRRVSRLRTGGGEGEGRSRSRCGKRSGRAPATESTSPSAEEQSSSGADRNSTYSWRRSRELNASGRYSSSRSWGFQGSVRAASSGSSPEPSTRTPTGSSSGARDARSLTAKVWPSGLWRRSSRRRRGSSRPTPRRPPRPSSSTLCRISSPTRARRAGSRHSCGAWSG